MTDREHSVSESNEEPDDPEELADAYEALEEDRRQRAALTNTDPDTVPTTPQDVVTVERAQAESAPDAAVVPMVTQADPRLPSQPAARVFLIDGKGASC